MLFFMARWTKKNFARVTDRSPDETMQWRLSRGSVRSHQVGVSRFTFTPGTRMPYGHRHREQEEVYVIVGGSGRMKLDDEIVVVQEWDIIRVPPEVMRAFEAGPDGLDVLCVAGVGRRAGTPNATKRSGPERDRRHRHESASEQRIVAPPEHDEPQGPPAGALSRKRRLTRCRGRPAACGAPSASALGASSNDTTPE